LVYGFCSIGYNLLKYANNMSKNNLLVGFY
jgi:hypothetical protein